MAENASVRRDLAAALRAIAWQGMQEAIFNHCSALAPAKSGNGNVMLLPPFGILWQDVTPDCLLGVDLDSGKVVEGEENISAFGACIHLPIYKRRPGVKAIMHVHSPNVCALGAIKDSRIRMINHLSCQLYDAIEYYDFEQFHLEEEEGRIIAEKLKDKQALMLRQNGALTVGSTVSVAYDALYVMEKACQIQILAMSSCQKLTEIPDKVCQEIRAYHTKHMKETSQKHLEAYMQYFAVER